MPASLPASFTGLRLGLGFAWVVIVVGEMTGVPTGLGAMIESPLADADINSQVVVLHMDRLAEPVVVVGHFHDVRAADCPADQKTACASAFACLTCATLAAFASAMSLRA